MGAPPGPMGVLTPSSPMRKNQRPLSPSVLLYWEGVQFPAGDPLESSQVPLVPGKTNLGGSSSTPYPQKSKSPSHGACYIPRAAPGIRTWLHAEDTRGSEQQFRLAQSALSGR
jgi:hypothetical protein